MLAYPNFFCLKILNFENMKTVFETIYADGDFFVDILDSEDETLVFKSTNKNVNDVDFIFFILSKEEALNLAGHILKLYSE